MSGYAYSPSSEGHRAQYVTLFSEITGLEELIAPLDFKTFRSLFRGRYLCLVTLDDKLWVYCLLSILRAFFGRRTVGLTLRPHSCFGGLSIKAFVKRMLFLFLKWFPNIKILAAVPFEWRPIYKKICSGWIYDPQFWDIHYKHGGKIKLPDTTQFSDEICKIADGRRIVTFVGYMSKDKGFDFFQKIATEAMSRDKDVLFVAAGRVLPEVKSNANLLKASQGIVFDKFLSDKDLESLYTISSVIWGCYSPQYDQTSGVLGRSIQFSVPICVREKSFVSEISEKTACPHLKLIYGDVDKGCDDILTYFKSFDCEMIKQPSNELLESWTAHSCSVILDALVMPNKKSSKNYL